MPLKGTISDASLGDILQLVGAGKTGVLEFENDLDSVQVSFRNGLVVHAESGMMSRERMLGSMLVGAEVITQGQLDQAYTERQRTLQRLGQVLQDLHYVDEETLKQFATLQLTETVYGLFDWKEGRYEFQQEDVPPPLDGVEPIKVDNILINGLRNSDEWPEIRERIPSYRWMVEQVRALPPVTANEWDASVAVDRDLSEIGSNERRIYELIGAGRTVKKLIHLGRLGEFETCQALSVLMQAGFVRIVKPPMPHAVDVDMSVADSGALRMLRTGGRVVISAFMVILAAFLIASTSQSLSGRGRGELRYQPDLVADLLAQTQIKVLRRALELYRYQTGSYPPSLDELVEGGFIRPRDIRYPFRTRYYYRIDEAGEVVLLPPVR